MSAASTRLSSDARAGGAELRLGIDIGGTKIAAGWIENGRLVDWTTTRTPKAAAESIVEVTLDLAATLCDRPPRGGVGIAFPGDLRGTDARVETAPNVPSFVGRSLRSLFERAVMTRWSDRFPFVALNDTCAALLAEITAGAAGEADHVGYLTVSTGVGGAAATPREIRNLEPGLRLFPDPTRSETPLEDLASGTGIARRAREELREASWGGSWLRDWAPKSGLETLSAADIARAAGRGDSWAKGLLGDSASWVARGLEILRASGHATDRMVLGGSVALKSPGYLDAVRSELGSSVDHWLVPASLGDERGVIGAAVAIREGRPIL